MCAHKLPRHELFQEACVQTPKRIVEELKDNAFVFYATLKDQHLKVQAKYFPWTENREQSNVDGFAYNLVTKERLPSFLVSWSEGSVWTKFSFRFQMFTFLMSLSYSNYFRERTFNFP